MPCSAFSPVYGSHLCVSTACIQCQRKRIFTVHIQTHCADIALSQFFLNMHQRSSGHSPILVFWTDAQPVYDPVFTIRIFPLPTLIFRVIMFIDCINYTDLPICQSNPQITPAKVLQKIVAGRIDLISLEYLMAFHFCNGIADHAADGVNVFCFSRSVLYLHRLFCHPFRLCILINLYIRNLRLPTAQSQSVRNKLFLHYFIDQFNIVFQFINTVPHRFISPVFI